MKVELITSETVFTDHQAEWDGLITGERDDDLFLKAGWQRIWWEHLGEGQLAITFVRTDEGELLGIASWFIDHAKTIHFVGCVDVVDYLDLIAHPDHVNEVAQAVLEFYLSDDAPEWNAIDLCNIPEASPSRQALLDAAEGLGLTAKMKVQEVCPVVTLPSSYEAYLESLESKQRKELKRKRKRTAPYEVDCYLVGPEHDLNEEVTIFLDLMAASAPEKAAFLEESGHKELFYDIAAYTFEQGVLDLIMLKIDGTHVAGMFQFGYGERMLLYNSGLKPGKYGALSPGIVLLTYSIEDAISRGFTYYDFLRGDETYKFRMGAEATDVFNIRIEK